MQYIPHFIIYTCYTFKFTCMIRVTLLAIGFILLIVQYFIHPIPNSTQFVIFLIGIILLGVPHGAADLLVATENIGKQAFSTTKFFAIYLSRLFLFAAILYFFPLAGNILFIFIAAYHFGETDLFQFKTDKLIGKLFVTSYGLVILSIILVNHFEEVIPIFMMFESGAKHIETINWIDGHRLLLMSIAGIAFFTTTFIYFLQYNDIEQKDKGDFITRFAFLCVLLYFMPMALGFTFYFIIWHSILSLKNIVGYLRVDNNHDSSAIIKQIVLYSALALAGIGIFGFSAFYYGNNSAMAGYIFIGLAVLTAPHMEVMHSMYKNLRNTAS